MRKKDKFYNLKIIIDFAIYFSSFSHLEQFLIIEGLKKELKKYE